MKNILILFIFLGLSISAQSQIESLNFGAGTSFASRILSFDETFSNEEKELARALEIPTISYGIDLGYTKKVSDKYFVEKGFSIRRMRFGTKKHTPPDSTVSATPQFNIIKQVVNQNQFSFYFKYIYFPEKWKKKHYLFLRGDALVNIRTYVVQEISFDQQNTRIFSGNVFGGDSKFHSYDGRVSLGGATRLFSKKKHTLMLEGFAAGYARSYRVLGLPGIGGYLPFKRDTVGFVWEFGAKLVYHFRIKKEPVTDKK